MASDAPHFISISSLKVLAPNTRYTTALFSHQLIYHITKQAAPIQTVLGRRQKHRSVPDMESKTGGHGRTSGGRRPCLPHVLHRLPRPHTRSFSQELQPRSAPSAKSGSHRLQPQEPAEPAPPQRPQLGRRRHLGAGAPLPAPPGAAEGPHPPRVTDTAPDAGEHGLAPGTTSRNCQPRISYRILEQGYFSLLRAGLRSEAGGTAVPQSRSGIAEATPNKALSPFLGTSASRHIGPSAVTDSWSDQ